MGRRWIVCQCPFNWRRIYAYTWEQSDVFCCSSRGICCCFLFSYRLASWILLLVSFALLLALSAEFKHPSSPSLTYLVPLSMCDMAFGFKKVCKMSSR